MDLKLIISDAFGFFRSNLVQIGTLCLPWLLANAIVEFLIITAGGPSQEAGQLLGLAWMFNLLIYPIYTGALILLMARQAQREMPENRELLATAIKLWQPFFMVHVVGVGLTVLGLMFLVLPGIYVLIRLSFAEFYIVLEDIKPMEAIRKSFHATRPHAIQIFLLIAPFAVPLILLRLILGTVIGAPEAAPVLNITVATLMAFVMLFLDVLMFRAYMAVTQEKPD